VDFPVGIFPHNIFGMSWRSHPKSWCLCLPYLHYSYRG